MPDGLQIAVTRDCLSYSPRWLRCRVHLRSSLEQISLVLLWDGCEKGRRNECRLNYLFMFESRLMVS